MQRGCTATWGEVSEGAALEPPISLSEKRESVGLGLFSDFEWVATVRFFGSTVERSNQLQAMTGRLLHYFSHFQNLANHSGLPRSRVELMAQDMKMKIWKSISPAAVEYGQLLCDTNQVKGSIIVIGEICGQRRNPAFS
jgi:hypothetical protein